MESEPARCGMLGPLRYASGPPRGKCLIVLASLWPVTFYIIGFFRDVNTLFNLNICALAENFRLFTDEINYNSL